MNLSNTEFTLLIVDDEKQNRLLLTELFGTTYKIIQAKNGVQALEKARQHRPDLILLDVLMPEMDGMDVLRELKRDDATRLIPVIFITALDSATDEANGLNLGAVDYISKPFHPPTVRVRVRNQLQLLHQRRLLEQLASLDGLTGIPNRRQFDATLLKEWHRCQRNQQPLSLIVADVDFFKKYNDALGHAAGDRVLQEVAATLRQAARRPGDLVARYGGEEFVLLLPETDATSAQALAEGLQQLLHSKAFAHPNSSLGPWLTMSMGGNTTVPSTTALDPEFFTLADAALYRAKHQGRNQVRWAN